MANVTIDGKPLSFDRKGMMEVPVGADTYLYKIMEGGSFNLGLGSYEYEDYAYKGIPQTPYRGIFQGATLRATLFLTKGATSETSKGLAVFGDCGASTTCEPTLYDIAFKWYDCDGTTIKLTVTCNDLYVVTRPVIRAGATMDRFDIDMRTIVEPTITYA